jgi:hypothetical protein
VRERDLGGWRNAGGRRRGLGSCPLVLIGTLGAVLVGVGGSAEAAPAVSVESHVHAGVVVLIPRRASVLVFEEITLSRFDVRPSVPILAGYRDLSVEAGRLARRAANTLTFAGSPGQVIFHYRLPHHPGPLRLTWPGAVDRVDVFIANGWDLPRKDNPAWQFVGTGTLVKNSLQVFNGYQTASVHAGETTTLVVASGAPHFQSPVTGRGTNRAGAVVLFLLAALASTSWAILYRRVQKVRALFAGEAPRVRRHEIS